MDVTGRTECVALHDIHSFTLCLGLVDVDEQQLRAEALDCQSKCNGCTDITSAQDGNFLSLFQLLFHFRIPPKP